MHMTLDTFYSWINKVILSGCLPLSYWICAYTILQFEARFTACVEKLLFFWIRMDVVSSSMVKCSEMREHCHVFELNVCLFLF